MNNMYEILSDNLARLRKSRNLTQAEFADIIKYSDKSVSKWETGMSVPSLETLVDIADFYEMTVDDLIRKPIDSEKVLIVEKMKKNNQLTILLLSVAAIFLIATVVFVASIFNGKPPAWRAYIWALPISFLLTTIFSCIWNKKFIYVCISCLTWTLITAIYLELMQYNQSYFLLFVIGAPIQIIIFLARGLKKDFLGDELDKQSRTLKRRIERQKERQQKRRNKKGETK